MGEVPRERLDGSRIRDCCNAATGRKSRHDAEKTDTRKMSQLPNASKWLCPRMVAPAWFFHCPIVFCHAAE